VGMAMELTTMPLFTDDDGVERVVHAWRIARAGDDAERSDEEERR